MHRHQRRFVQAKCDRCGRTTAARQNGEGDLYRLPEEWGALADEGDFCQPCISRYAREDWAKWIAQRQARLEAVIQE